MPRKYYNTAIIELHYLRNGLGLQEVHYVDMNNNRFVIGIDKLIEVRIINNQMHLLIDI